MSLTLCEGLGRGVCDGLALREGRGASDTVTRIGIGFGAGRSKRRRTALPMPLPLPFFEGAVRFECLVHFGIICILPFVRRFFPPRRRLRAEDAADSDFGRIIPPASTTSALAFVEGKLSRGRRELAIT